MTVYNRRRCLQSATASGIHDSPCNRSRAISDTEGEPEKGASLRLLRWKRFVKTTQTSLDGERAHIAKLTGVAD